MKWTFWKEENGIFSYELEGTSFVMKVDLSNEVITVRIYDLIEEVHVRMYKRFPGLGELLATATSWIFDEYGDLFDL